MEPETNIQLLRAMKKTIGMTGQKTMKTRDYGPKPQCPECGTSRKGRNGSTHLQGRPTTRGGDETDTRR